MTYATINPYTGDTVATFPDATDEEVKTALDSLLAAGRVDGELVPKLRGRLQFSRGLCFGRPAGSALRGRAFARSPGSAQMRLADALNSDTVSGGE